MDNLYFDDLHTQRTNMNLIDFDKLYRKLSKSFGRDVVFISINRLNGERDLKSVLEYHCRKVSTIDDSPVWDDKEIKSISSKSYSIFPVHCGCHNLIDRIDEIV